MEEVIDVELVVATIVLPIEDLFRSLVVFKTRTCFKDQITVTIIILNDVCITHCNIVGTLISCAPLLVGLVVVAIPFKHNMIVSNMVN